MKVTINFKTTVNPLWITNNYSTRSRRSPTMGHFVTHDKAELRDRCVGAKSTDVACKSVYNYLNNLSSKTDTYTTHSGRVATTARGA